MGGRASRDKGARFEREIVQMLRDAGLDAYRIPLSGAMAGFKGDIVIKDKMTMEAKSRASGFKFLYDNLSPDRPLIVKADRQEPLFICTLAQAITFIK